MRRSLGYPLLVALISLTALSCQRQHIDDLGPVGDFALTERNGDTVRADDLRGKVWIASFVFTRCTGPCPQVSASVARLQHELKNEADVRFVTFTVDPKNDGPKELSLYAEHFQADPHRWLFLTGKKDDIYRLLHEGFHVSVEETGNEVMHSTKLVVVDRDGHIRGYFDGVRDTRDDNADRNYETNLQRVRQTVAALVRGDAMNVSQLFGSPEANVTYNAIAGVLVILGYLAIKMRWVRLHITCMLTALVTSAVFLASYLYYHFAVKQGVSTKFSESNPGAPPWVGPLYYTLLITHVVLAAIVPPLALYTAYQGLRNRLAKHVRIARWTLPIWLYVSVTGVIVYWMLYRLFAS